MSQGKPQQTPFGSMFVEDNSCPSQVQERLMTITDRGMIAPESLSLHEIERVCYALHVHYALAKIEQD